MTKIRVGEFEMSRDSFGVLIYDPGDMDQSIVIPDDALIDVIDALAWLRTQPGAPASVYMNPDHQEHK